MHELSVAESLLGFLEKIRDEKQFEKINRVVIGIGQLSGVETEALRLALDTINTGTILEGAVVQMEKVPLRARCSDCSMESEIRNWEFQCAGCKSNNIEITAGESVEIIELDVD